MSARERLYLFDTTLRDGAQTTGVDFSLEDKRTIAALLDRLGVDYVEGGYPGANPLDTEFFAEKRTKTAKFTAFGMTKRAGRSASNDPGVAALLDAEADAICFVAKAWDYHVHVALETTLEDNLDGIRESVAAHWSGAGRCSWIASTSSTATRPTPIMRSPAPARLTNRVRAGWCSATPMAARSARDRPHRRRGAGGGAGRASRHPCARRLRLRGRELAGRGRSRRTAYPGHPQRAWASAAAMPIS
jgi:hypothetical protein